ncbi:CIC11C00000001819 [Sungouiella intermedia]|uniref:CIC11C00000001819 n=1 Tax=Sungouiella intermedia TaxID=45354 RepID=A0A1L0DH61_9ASCO|nr:CIC11C00000001819 [[Candida] intermedia]
MSSNALPRLTKREVLAVSFVPIIALLVFIFVGLIRFLLYRDRKSSRRGTSGTISPLPPPEPVLRPEEAEIENPPPPPYQPDKLPPYPTAPAPAYLRDERAES